MEQGRERSPSTQTADALARALLMDGHSTKHHFRLAGITPSIPVPADQSLDPDLRELIDSLTDNPIIVLGDALDVVVANPLGEGLFCGWPRGANAADERKLRSLDQRNRASNRATSSARPPVD